MEGVVDNRFEILSVLGEGATSIVYKARHLDMDRVVALKFLKSGVTRSGDKLTRFQNEAQLASQLHHPNICAVFSFGIWKQTLYLAMEYLEGKTLGQLIDEQGPLPFADFESIFTQVCEALSYAHEKGIVHRDLKPGNIVIVGNTAKIVDFGIAKLLDGYGQEVQRLTQTGQMFGTPLYMSPEQCAGMPVDTRSDIYSIGCVMYQAACGQAPFEGTSPLDVMFKHINARADHLMIPPRLAYPETTSAVIGNAMHKDPKSRYQTMNELADDLRAVKSGKRVESRKLLPRKIDDRKKFFSSGKLVLAAALALTALALVVAPLVSWRKEQMPEITQTIERQLDHVDHQIVALQHTEPQSAQLGRLLIRSATLAAQADNPVTRATAAESRDKGRRILMAHPEAFDDSLYEMFVSCARAMAPGSTMEKIYASIAGMDKVPDSAMSSRDKFIARRFLELDSIDQASGTACGLAQSLSFKFKDPAAVELGQQLAKMIQEKSPNRAFRSWAYRIEALSVDLKGDTNKAIELIKKAITNAEFEYTNARSVASRSYNTKNASEQLTEALAYAEVFYGKQSNFVESRKQIERMRQFGAHNNELDPWARGELQLINYVSDPAEKLVMHKEVRRISEQAIGKWNKQAQLKKIPPGENVTLDEWARFMNYRTRACLALGDFREAEDGSLRVVAQMQNNKITGSQKWLAVLLLRDCMLMQKRTAEAKRLEKQFPNIFEAQKQSPEGTK